MTQFFGIPIDTLTWILVVITAIIISGVVLLAITNPLFFKIGVRNIPRRRMQMLLIVFALMLSTTLLSSVLATGDVITNAVNSVAIYNYGNIDEIIEGGGYGPQHLYPDGIYYSLLDGTRHSTDIASVSGALRELNLLVADETSRQVRSSVTGLGVIPGSEQSFGGMQDATNNKHLRITNLAPNEVYLNQTTAQLLNAHTGDTLYIYSQNWPGQRYTMHVSAIVQNGGLVGDAPFFLTPIQTFRTIEHDPDAMNQIFVENSGGGGVNGVGLTDRVTAELNALLPSGVHVIQVKQQGVQNSQQAQSIFSRIFALFSLFALAIGLLLIFLIFILLSAERRAEMGMARAIGVQRRHLILMFLFEGAVYDLIASFIGLAFGIGIGILLVFLLGPTLQRFNFPLKLTVQPRSLVIAYCLGVIFTFCSVVISSWLVSRMTVVEAMRDLPEPSSQPLTIGELGMRLLQLCGQLGNALLHQPRTHVRRIRRITLEHIPDVVFSILRSLILLGFVPLLLGYWLMQFGLSQSLIIPFSLGLTLLVIGGGSLLRAIVNQVILLSWGIRHPGIPTPSLRELSTARIAQRVIYTLMGVAIAAYWGLPFDALARLGLPRFQGGIEVFFVAGAMMIVGTVWAIIVNAELLVGPLLAFCSRLPNIYATAKLASAYPLNRRLRTGLSVIMFCLVVFAMTIMAVITNATQNTYADINAQTGGYDIQATAYFQSLPNTQNALRTSLIQHGINPNAFSAIGIRNTTAVGMIQLTANAPRWTIYPAQVVSGGFLEGYGIHLIGRARGFSSDAAIWQALQTHPNYALIDSSSLQYNPNVVSNSPIYDPSSPSAANAGAPATPPGFDPRFTFTMDGLYQGDTNFPAVPVWITDLQTTQATKFTIIGIVDNSDSSHFGLYIPQTRYSASSVPTDVSPRTLNTQSYYFKVAPGQDARTLALALGSAYLDHGLETTVLQDAIWQLRGPRILLSDVLLGVVGLTLLLGVAALAITGTRAVIERRQQIGMLRALGCKRRLVQASFLLESFLVGTIGSLLGVLLGLLLANNIFAANFFEQYQTGLVFSIPWNELGIIVGVALLAAFLGAILPAWQAGKVTPAEALRYQ